MKVESANTGRPRTFPGMRVLALLILALLVHGAEPLLTLTERNVTVVIHLEHGEGAAATLVGTFTPDDHEPPLHLYDIALIGDAGGVATRMDLEPGPAEATGPLTADQTPHDHAGVSIYPDGPVTLRLPIRLPAGPPDGTAEVGVKLSYMACTMEACLRPLMGKVVTLSLPTVPGAPTTAPASVDPEALRAAVRTEVAAAESRLGQRIDRALAGLEERIRPPGQRIAFHHPETVAEVDALIAAAHAEGKSAILDFTGPSCTVCQQMARDVLRDPQAVSAWMRQVPIEIDTDTHGELADWQTTRFHTQSRPLYVRLDPDGTEARWSKVFHAKQDPEVFADFLAWAEGGEGADVADSGGWLSFLFLAIGGGLFTLLMPCTYPMIPFTVNFFTKQASQGRSLLPLAAFYSGGIVVCFVLIGAILAGVLRANPAQLSGSPWTNLVFTAVFLLLGLSLLGAFVLHLPASVENALGGGRGGYLGALGMGLTFVVTAFACTAPFAGVVLGGIASSGDGGAWVRLVVGMGVYGATIGLPFFFLSMSPGLLRRLPKAGSWMNEFKVVGGLIEIAAAFKFLNIADNAWGWGIFGRDVVFAIWAVIFALIGAYLFGRWRTDSDSPVETLGAGRVCFGIAFLAIALWFVGGVTGNDLGRIESFLAPE